jgi:hypothetical protein
VVLEGEALGPGKHDLLLAVPGVDSGPAAALAVTIAVGARRGPRAFLIGGLSPGDALGLAVARGVLEAIDPAELSGSVVALGRAAPAGDDLDHAFPGEATGGALDRVAHFILSRLLAQASFAVEIRSGPQGWNTRPHVRADLEDGRARRLARAFGAEIVVGGAGGKGSLRRVATRAGVPTLVYEGGELGTLAPAAGIAGVLSLLRGRKMLPGVPVRPAQRATVGEITRVTSARAAWLVPTRQPGSIVEAGEPIADAYDEAGRLRGAIVSPARGVLLAVPTTLHRTRVVARIGKITSLARAPRRKERGGTIGWSEWVALPDLGVKRLHAKIDTGARTSALHVAAMQQVGERGGKPVLELTLPVGRRVDRGPFVTARVRVRRYLVVRDSGGHAERRPVIETTLVLGGVARRVRVTLTDRGDMLFPMLVGRTALGDGVIVDPNRRHLAGEPDRG